MTGGLGFIGANVAHALVGEGAQVTVVDALIEGHGGDLRNVDAQVADIVVADVGDAGAIGAVLARADYVFDLAGQVSHIASHRDPERDITHNAIARLRFLEILQRVNPQVRAVFASTRQVYGRVGRSPVLERDLPRPIDVNGVAKLAAEHLYLLHHRTHGLAGVVLRLSNVYGPRQHLCRDDLGVLPVFIRRALRGETLHVFGDGSDERDVLHVDDAVEAMLLAALTRGAAGRVFNLGGPAPHTVGDLARLTAAASPSAPSVQIRAWPADQAALNIGSICLSSSLAAELLGWRPRIEFADGIAQTLAWFQRHPERYL